MNSIFCARLFLSFAVIATAIPAHASRRVAAPIVLATVRVEQNNAPTESREDYIQRKLREWNLRPDDLRRELDEAGRIIRRHTEEIGDRVADATSDLRIIAVIKGKYALDDFLSAWQISIGCKDGHVTLTGSVRSPDLIGRAIVIALETEGVVDVVSSLKVRPDEPRNP